MIKMILRSCATQAPRIGSGAQSRLPNARAFGGALLLFTGLSACTMAPHYERPAAPVAADWPVATPSSSAQIKWRDLFLDPKLQQTIQLALDNNRDLRASTLNVARAKAQYGIERSGLFPALDGNASGTKSHTDAAGDSQAYTANLGLSWEIDLFGRVRSLSNAAKEDFFATQENRNAAEISLIAATAQAWLDLAADRDALKLTQQTYDVRKNAFDIAEGRSRLGAIDDLDLADARTLMEQARGDLAAAETAVDQDKAALTLLTGVASISDDLLPDGLHDGQLAASLPVGLPSDVLLKRPDVLAAEHDLKAANADIGAARAAFFPSISLTGQTGSASTSLGQLFNSGTGQWSYGAKLGVPIFEGGANINGLRSAKAGRDIAVANYEGAIQQAFSDVSQALAVRARIDERLDAGRNAADAATTAMKLSQARYDAGADSYLVLLDAQRTQYGAQGTLIQLEALKASNLVALYRALGDDDSLN